MRKRYYNWRNNNKCVDCSKRICDSATRCVDCNNKFIGKNQRGKNNPRYIDGRTLKKYYCKDCNTLITWGHYRCMQCEGKKHSKRLTGRKHPKEQCLKMSKALMGKNNPMYGKKHTKETLQKLLVALHAHHIYLKENSDKVVYLSSKVHGKLHVLAYNYIVEKFGKREIDKYIKWFCKKEGLNSNEIFNIK